MDIVRHRRRVGHTALQIGPIGLGVAPLGNLFSTVTEDEAKATFETAIRGGIDWFDVAPLYGLGLAEERLGRLLKESPTLPVVSTKVGRLLEPSLKPISHEQFAQPLPNQVIFDYSAAGIERAVEGSLRRLDLSRLQMLLLHDIDRLTHPVGHREVVETVLKEALPTLRRMQADGRVDAIGLGINEWDVGYEVLASTAPDCILLAGRYTLLDQSAHTSGFLRSCERRGMSVLAGGVFNSGFLAGGVHYGYRIADNQMVSRRDELITVCRRHDVPLPAVALQFTAAHPAITSVVVGARSGQEVDSILAWSRWVIPDTLWRDLKNKKLIPMEAHTP